ncbi:hypothetical protein [Moorena bouillonii]|uniref:Uncharacterized protein n=1 Tax=Moorena bouillonii PNG TaxID=568701 RepID=A0A1U7MWT0_9CYAN|nr:hypothetical protein [Moorena bouillonii]OLT58177.1 hypothetical protein BJP37_03090 [Moorena bouillonii PNG]
MTILYELKIRKLGLIELLVIAFYIYFKNIKNFMITYLTILVPFSVILYTLQVYFVPFFWQSWLLLVIIYSTIFSEVLLIVCSIITENFILSIKTNLNNVIQVVLSRLLALIGLNLRFDSICGSGLLLMIIPGIIYWVNNGYYGLAFVLRDQRCGAAFAYSRAIVKGNWWRVFLFGFINLFVIFGSFQIFSKLFSFIPIIKSSEVLMTVLTSLLSGFISVVPLVGYILLFFNLEFQKNLQS